MNGRYVIFATLAALVWLVAFDFFWYGFLFGKMNLNAPATDAGYEYFHIIGEFLFVLLLVLLYPRFMHRDYTTGSAISYGIWLSLLATGPGMIHMMAETKGDMGYPLFILAGSLVGGVVAAIIINAIYKSQSKSPESTANAA